MNLVVTDKEEIWAMDASKACEQKKTVCPLDCPDSCGMIATLEGGRIVSLQGDRQHPYTNGFICRKMRRYHEKVYAPDRLLYPQIRTGKKGEGKFARISWDEAWEILVNRLCPIVEQYGGEAVLPYSYAGNMGTINRFAGHPFFHRLGALRLDETICFAAAGAAWGWHCGKTPGSPPELAAEADLIVAWGINIKVSNVHFWQYVTAARQRGGKLLVIDPYMNSTGRSADYYMSVRPGGDTALALGVTKSLVEQNLCDRAKLEQQTEGFERLEEYLLKTPWPVFAEQSGLSPEAIGNLARLLHDHPQTFCRIGVGLTRNSRGGMAVRAILSLAAVLGLFEGGPGRGVLLSAGAFRGNRDKLRFPELSAKAAPMVNMIQLGEALTVRQPQIKALFVYNANPLSAAPDTGMVRRGLLREDLFTVVHEQVLSPTACYADLLLPATTFLENKDLYTSYGQFYLGLAEPVISPLAETISNFDLFQNLAGKMGYADAPFKQTIEERITGYLLDMEGLPAESAAQIPVPGEWQRSTLAESTGSLFRQGGGCFVFARDDDPLTPPYACLSEPGEFADPDLNSRYPFELLTPPHADLLNSTFGERYTGTPGEVLIHPEDAARAHIGDGEIVILENFRGRAQRVARITSATRKGLLVAEGLYWPVDESGINDLTSQKLSDMGGGATFHESRVALRAMHARSSHDLAVMQLHQ